LWLGVKKLIGSHISTLAEAKAATDLVASGAVRTTVSTFGELDNVAELLVRLESGLITGKAVVSIS
jgi:D-arabinose 1-dehydrogenase-like Zn-dependent alcohol dehydrogenase